MGWRRYNGVYVNSLPRGVKAVFDFKRNVAYPFPLLYDCLLLH